ncbi:MAG: glycoside hydrolase family 1 protein, partial [Candidatus Sericytochromatia bacterium]|nr:glycoside hydrolase family 1 protein [Candidatus Tanganyikabacteria bacterium]
MSIFYRVVALSLAGLLAACGQVAPGKSGNTGPFPILPPWPGQNPPAQEPAKSAFAKDFLWGVATSGFQTEGYDTNSQWAKWALSGRTPQLPGRATDSWNRYPEDFDLARNIGLNAYRFSVEWSRIEPQPGQFDRLA